MITEYKLYLSLVLSQPDTCVVKTVLSEHTVSFSLSHVSHKTICSVINYGRLGSDRCKATDRATDIQTMQILRGILIKSLVPSCSFHLLCRAGAVPGPPASGVTPCISLSQVPKRHDTRGPCTMRPCSPIGADLHKDSPS